MTKTNQILMVENMEGRFSQEILIEQFSCIPESKVLTYNAGINLGNLFTKFVGDGNIKNMCLTSAKKISERDAVLKKCDSNLIKVNGQYYVVGEDANTADKIENRDVEMLKVVAAYAIARMVTSNKKNFTKNNNFRFKAIDSQIVIGLCIDEFKDKELVAEMKRNFNQMKFNIEYKDSKFMVNFDVKNLLAEGYCHYQLNRDLYVNKRRVAYVDVGSKTWDICIVKKDNVSGELKLDKAFSLTDAGTLFLMRRIKDVITDGPISMEDLELLLREGYVQVGKREYSLEQFSGVIRDYAFEYMREINQQYDNELAMVNQMVIFGGGAELVHDAFKEYFGKDTLITKLDDAVYVNAQAYYDASFN